MVRPFHDFYIECQPWIGYDNRPKVRTVWRLATGLVCQALRSLNSLEGVSRMAPSAPCTGYELVG